LTDAELAALTATEAAAKLAGGDLSSEELVSACLARIDELEPSIQAWAFLDRERALEQAKAADETRREGKGIGPLHGLPVGVKDIIGHGGHADRERLQGSQRASAARGCGLRHRRCAGPAPSSSARR
jgi:Asp-tRNA(Asn)/Glu-tRNA(Gln) amidotransferase A subunit family amidase